MGEKLEIYDLKDNLIKIQDREDYYKEIREEFLKTKKITKKVKAIRLLLMNSNGRIFLQKRSKLKNENPGLYDKTVGGDVQAGDSYESTVVKECAEELGFPASILNEEDFKRSIKTTDISIVGIFRKVDIDSNFKSKRVLEGKKSMIQPYISAVYFGYYDGPIKFVDGESCGIEVFSIEDLEKDIKSNPEKFTEDIKIMIKKYRSYIKPISFR